MGSFALKKIKMRKPTKIEYGIYPILGTTISNHLLAKCKIIHYIDKIASVYASFFTFIFSPNKH